MLDSQYILDLSHELVVDNFAGGGGASTGIEMALGRHVDIAINHDRLALGMHRINHPQTVHYCEDVFDVDPATVCRGRPVGLVHLSPDCKHFSRAKGGKPLSKRIRGLILVALRWAKYGAGVITCENVNEIRTWGPLVWTSKRGGWGWFPDPAHLGRSWRAFRDILGHGIHPDHPDLPEFLEVLAGTVTKAECVRGFGYHVEDRDLRASALGAPTIRNRFFMVARRDGRPVVWPEPTHGVAQVSPSRRGRGRRLRPVRAIAGCIDWSLPCPSIFLSGAEAKAARCKRPLAKPTLWRVAAGVDRFVLRANQPFLVNVNHQGGERLESIAQPARTVTAAKRGEKALVSPVISRFNGDHAGRQDSAGRNYSPGEPVTTLDTSNRIGIVTGTLVGAGGPAYAGKPRSVAEPMNTLCVESRAALVSAHLMVNTTGHPGAAAEAPAPTIPSGGHHALVTGTLAPVAAHITNFHAGSTGAALDEPLDTVTAGGQPARPGTGNPLGLVSAALVQVGYGEREGQAPRTLDPRRPLGTAVAGGGKHAVVTGTLVGAGGRAAQSRPRGLNEALHTGTAKADTCLAAVNMVKLRGDCETHPPGTSVDAPIHTVSSGGNHGVVAASIVRHFGQSVGQPADAPAPTTTAGGGGKTGLIAASVAAYYGSERDGQKADEPARTLLSKPRLGLVESTVAPPPLTEEQVAGARRVAAFLREHGVEFEGEFATVQGFVIVDIGMRMLTPRELFRAQGFCDGYVIDRAWLVDPATGNLTEVTLTKEQQTRMCGNSVCPPVMAALVAANVPELSILGRKSHPARMAA